MTISEEGESIKCLGYRSQMKPFDELGLDECTYYWVWVSMRSTNPPFKAVLYTGFKTGGYRIIHYLDDVCRIERSTVFEVISRIGRS